MKLGDKILTATEYCYIATLYNFICKEVFNNNTHVK